MLEGTMFLDESLLVGAKWRDESATIHPHTWHLPWAPKRRQVGEEEQRRACEGTINGAGTLVATPASAVKLTCSKADTMFNHHGPDFAFCVGNLFRPWPRCAAETKRVHTRDTAISRSSHRGGTP